MINNYYNIPGIPCEHREAIRPTTSESINQKELRCQGLNPSDIYKTLYPNDADPSINFQKYSQKNLNIGSKISSKNVDVDQCATNCTDNNNCTYFNLEKDNNKCLLYSVNSTSKNPNFNNLQKNNKLTTWRKNSLLAGTSNCNLQDNFISQPSNYFPDTDNPNKAIETISQPNLSQNECLNACLYNDNCKSVVFAQSEPNCSLYKSNKNTARQEITKSQYDNTVSSTYIKNDQVIKNRFDAPNYLSNYYKKYPTKGKVGDSFCEYVEADQKCKTSYIVGPGGSKDVPKKNNTKKQNIPKPKLCMPPDCIPEAPATGMRNILKINGNLNLSCKRGDKKCEESIGKTPYYTTDQMGLPTKYGDPSPPNPYLPYTSKYNQYHNLNIDHEEMNDKPEPGAFTFPEDCANWCSESMDCGGYSYHFASDGKAICKYHPNSGMKVLRDKLKYKDGTTAFIKRGNPLIQDPKLSQVKKPYFNNFGTAETGVEKQNVRVCKFTDGSTSYEDIDNEDQNGSQNGNQNGNQRRRRRVCETFENYGKCPDKKTDKKNPIGSNCPTPLIPCEETEYGCCSDEQTPKINEEGENCPIIDKNICLNSKHGCCTGTIIPKEYLCEEEENELCQFTNCALNDRQRGDPYAFYEGSGKKCSINIDCDPNEMCVNGICKKYNSSFYNSLNYPQKANQKQISGRALNDYMCGCDTEAKLNKKCPNTYEPVCGTDGKTYQNKCHADNSGVETQYYGACSDVLENFYSPMLRYKQEGSTNYTKSLWSFILFFILLVIFLVLYLKK